MNQAAKDAVELIDEIADNATRFESLGFPRLVERTAKIIAGLELLRGVAEGTHVIVPMEMDKSEWKRSKPFKQGYACGWKDLITELHSRAKGMNDPHATAVLNAAAWQLGNKRRGKTARAMITENE